MHAPDSSGTPELQGHLGGRDAVDPRDDLPRIRETTHSGRGRLTVVVQAGDEGIRFLLVSGKPLEEPVAWYGPIVMNTKAQLQQAISELRDGTFIKR